ncbi:hypothetical protein KM043_016609 [Ampulex compressa]|nr:hypothetical protein KM043_016609 [Ampulex compressa]
MFVGYSSENKGFRVRIPEESKVVVTRDIKFVERRITSDREAASYDNRNQPEDIIWNFNPSDRRADEVIEDNTEHITEGPPEEEDVADVTEAETSLRNNCSSFSTEQ